MQYLLPSQKLWGSLFQRTLWHMGHLGDAYSSKGLLTFLLFLLGEGHPPKTSSSVKDRYHFTSSLSFNMLFANKSCSPPAGGLFCSDECWRALAYATTFSLGTSLMSCKHKWTWLQHKLLPTKAWWCSGSLEGGLP